jgi:hypothetical protein
MSGAPIARGVLTLFDRPVKHGGAVLLTLFSLREHYNGPLEVLTALADDELRQWRPELERAGAAVRHIRLMGREGRARAKEAKAQLYGLTAWEETLFLEPYVMVTAPIDRLWAYLDQHPVVAAAHSLGRFWDARARYMRAPGGEAKPPAIPPDRPATNTSVVAWRQCAAAERLWQDWATTLRADMALHLDVASYASGVEVGVLPPEMHRRPTRPGPAGELALRDELAEGEPVPVFLQNYGEALARLAGRYAPRALAEAQAAVKRIGFQGVDLTRKL